ncbi:MAG: metallophosphoesterase family protein [Lachnospiraceae bacterium]|nr:metallophosphoesterase family protein [Lachnospiraceae bacterium]
MDIAVFSDIHANHVALQACFDYCVAKGITRFILLGDHITECPYPEKTLEQIYMLKQYFNCVFLRGNREQMLLNYRKKGAKGWKNGSASGALLYTFEALSLRDLNFFQTLKTTENVEEAGYPPFTICHGSPTSTTEMLFKDRRNARKALSQLETEFLVHGNTHRQDAFKYHDRLCLDPGSVGLPRSADGQAQFLLLHAEGGEWIYEHVRIPYDREALYKDFADSGLMERAPAWCALTLHTLRTGVDLSEAVTLRAMQLCREERGKAEWPNIPEIYWAFALREMRIDLNGREIPKPPEKKKDGA